MDPDERQELTDDLGFHVYSAPAVDKAVPHRPAEGRRHPSLVMGRHDVEVAEEYHGAAPLFPFQPREDVRPSRLGRENLRLYALLQELGFDELDRGLLVARWI